MVYRQRRNRFFTVAAIAWIIAALAPAKTFAQSVTEFPLAAGYSPTGIAAGPDGALWFTGFPIPAAVGRITTAGAITSYPLPHSSDYTLGITTGSDGALWFGGGENKIGRITTSGAITEFSLPTIGSYPYELVSGPDGAVWFTETGSASPPVVPAKIGRITTSGVIQEFLLPAAQSAPFGITSGPDGALWFAEAGCASCSPVISGKIGRITTAGVITEFSLRDGMAPFQITQGPDGALWFTHTAASGVQSTIGRITTDGTVTEFPIAIPGDGGITLGPDGALWFTETNNNVKSVSAMTGRITTSGVETDFATPNPNGSGGWLTAGPDGNIWFTEFYQNIVGRIALAPSNALIHVTGYGTVTSIPGNAVCTAICGANFTIGQSVSLTASPAAGWTFTGWSGACSGASCGFTAGSGVTSVTAVFAPVPPPTGPLAAAVLPSSRSVQVGATATAFATIINSGNTAAAGCSIAPRSLDAGAFTYQTTSSVTNATTGLPNTPVTIQPNTAQSFVISLESQSPLGLSDVFFAFSCTNTGPAAITSGVNTLLFSVSATATPDVVALGATASNDGILRIAGRTGSNAFAVATVNLGAGGAITATASTAGAMLPLNLAICQTNPLTAACLAPAGPSATATINANATPTFSIFAAATDAIPFAPAANRIFVQFKDATGAVRGSTSVAVATQ